jgi:hypothetical protein
VAFVVGLAIWAFLYAIEAHRGGSVEGAAGFAIGFGLCWLMVVE